MDYLCSHRALPFSPAAPFSERIFSNRVSVLLVLTAIFTPLPKKITTIIALLTPKGAKLIKTLNDSLTRSG